MPATDAKAPVHDFIVSLVERRLSLHPQRAAAKTPHQQSMQDRQIAVTDACIVREVDFLNGLTEEVKWTEG